MAYAERDYGSGVPATSWAAGVDPAEVARMRSEPGFPAAMAQAARSMVDTFQGNRLLNRIINDRERNAFALLTLYLDATPDAHGRGLTAARIVALCRELALCSRGRAKAMLMLMRWAGYLEPVPDPHGDRRQRPLVPTTRMIAMQTDRWRRLLGALALLEPLAEAVIARLDETAFREDLTRAMVSRFIGGMRPLEHAPALQLFVSRDGGLMIAFQLLLSGAPDDVFPPEQLLNVAVAALGRQFHVSRAHVLKLLRDAEAEGLLQRVPGAQGGVRMLPPLAEALSDFLAAAFVILRASAREALAAEAARAGAAPLHPPAGERA